MWILAVCCLAVSAAPFDENVTRLNGEHGWYIPRVDDTYDWVDKDVAESIMKELENIETFELTLVTVKYYLYTKANPSKGKQITATSKSIAASNFNAANPTRFVIHGWRQSYTSSMYEDIRDAWLSKGDFNIIIVDWALARSVDYVSSVLAVPVVGKKVGSMIDYLCTEHGMSLATLYVIGHSLVAHVAGYAGKNVKSGQILSIIGLDPALPLFSYDKPEKRLNSTDAFYVQTIQTDGGRFGFLKPIGKGAFYPNGGESQPGCSILPVFCNHQRSVTYYAEAIADDDFVAVKCENYLDAVGNQCGSTYSPVLMGAATNASMVAGEYYVPVNSKAPFGTLN